MGFNKTQRVKPKKETRGGKNRVRYDANGEEEKQ